MKGTDPTLVQAIREYARSHPGDDYKKIAISFGPSEITIKRICKDLGRGKNWRRGQKSATPDEAKFWERVDIRADDECWLWKGCKNESGYGFLHFNGRSQCAHRVAYELTFGIIPEGKEIDHKCRLRACCNPIHLEPVTHAENMERVRSLQSKQTPATGDGSTSSTDTGSLIDTRVKAKPEARFDLAHPFINEDKINHVAPSTGRVSVSMEPCSSTALNVVGEHEDVDLDRVADMDAPGETGSACPVQASDNKPDKFCVYQVSSRRNDICVNVLARSEYDAERKFESEWGSEFDVDAQKLEGPVDDKIAAVRLSTQERELASEFDRWQHSEYGRRHFAKVAQEVERERQAQEAEDTRRTEDEIEKMTDRFLAEQDYLLAREQSRISHDPRKRPPHLPRYDRESTYRSDCDREYYGEEGHEL